MKVAIISDIHGNIAALDAVLSDVKIQSPDAVYCLGDLVGYAAFPNEVIDRIQQQNIKTIIGNYDDGVGFDRDECGCAYRDREEQRLGDLSLRWTQKTVTPERKAFLQALPFDRRFVADGKRIRLVHGSPRRINEYLFEDRPLSSFQRLAASSECDMASPLKVLHPRTWTARRIDRARSSTAAYSAW